MSFQKDQSSRAVIFQYDRRSKRVLVVWVKIVRHMWCKTKNLYIIKKISSSHDGYPLVELIIFVPLPHHTRTNKFSDPLHKFRNFTNIIPRSAKNDVFCQKCTLPANKFSYPTSLIDPINFRTTLLSQKNYTPLYLNILSSSIQNLYILKVRKVVLGKLSLLNSDKILIGSAQKC